MKKEKKSTSTDNVSLQVTLSMFLSLLTQYFVRNCTP